ncbi:hypothetical protein BEI02_15265 [Elizabethkingia sp. HvH-WGS333]|uniref:hypothetical protein n=1 Tax=Elizabethkingia TaxID=308865 RepID=UPI0007416F07|nr:MULTISPECIES: hypothetical protein [Elizabethkingia]KUG13570.1 hypothetical protein AMC91_02640 [Elizabethkingia miricola]MCL1656024.1 hypothetical protein [Elizabethkingia miricola]MDX8566654.1 hypothetical protein [Elizabethkingia sp. HX XZB]MDX8570143.1 hypothetical protein [Elizabethkingia sp. HX QKY]OIK46372.1 hypothetical protein BEI02_15265 [Elizabethkingia sp. HvH-WGS333]
MILVCKSLLKNTKITAITLFPFILLKKKELKEDFVLLNHEKIHLRQQLELLVLPFYILYMIEYGIKYFKLKNAHKAYLAISFEREAYAKEDDFDYLKKRKFWNFIKYW